jgi:hypothetical protein
MDNMLVSGLFETLWTFIQGIGCPSISFKNFLKKNFLKIEMFFLK